MAKKLKGNGRKIRSARNRQDAADAHTASQVLDDSRYVLVLSDLHCGGSTALMPPEFRTIEGQIVAQSDIQKQIWSAWTRCCQEAFEIIGKDTVSLVLNGDLIEGIHHRTSQLVSLSAMDHMSMAIGCLDPIVSKCRRVYCSLGTECHSGHAEIAIGKYFNAVVDPDTGLHAWHRIDLLVRGVRTIFHHHMPTTSRDYLRHNALGIMLGNEQLVAVRGGETIPRVLGMAHRHLADAVISSYGVSFSTPSWQAATRFVGKVVPSAGFGRTDVGAVLLDFGGSRFRETGIPSYIPLTYKIGNTR
jgi:hypothetical protein